METQQHIEEHFMYLIRSLVFKLVDDENELLETILRDPPVEFASQTSMLQNIMRYATAAMAAGIAVWRWDLQTPQSSISTNKAFFEVWNEKVTHITWQELIKRIVHPEDRNIIEKKICDVLVSKQHLAPMNLCYRARAKPLELDESDDSRPNDDYKYICVLAKLICDRHGEPHSMIGIHVDSTDSKLLEIEKLRAQHLQDTVTEAQRHQQEMADFADHILHEVRNPGAGIRGSAELLGDTVKSARKQLQRAASRGEKVDPSELLKKIDEMQEFVDCIEACSSHQKDILDDVLSLSKLDAGSVELKPECFYLDDLCHNIIRMMSHGHKPMVNDSMASQQAGPVLSVEFLDAQGSPIPQTSLRELHDTAFHLYDDGFYLKQILLNFVGNAQKFCSHGSITLRAQLLNETPESSTFRFAVADTGVGIPRNVIENGTLFERFRQIHSREYKGTGLGLPICQKLVRLFDANEHIHVESEVGVGSEFSFQLSLHKCIDESTHLQSNAGHGRGRETEGVLSQRRLSQTNPKPAVGTQNSQLPSQAFINPETASSSKGKCVIVEDNLLNSKLLARFVQDAGLAPVQLYDGQEFVEYFERLKPEEWDHIRIVFTDHQMPRMLGLEAATRVREIERKLRSDSTERGTHFRKDPIPICSLSGSASLEDNEYAHKASVSDFCTKPFTKRQIHDLISKHADRSAEKK